MATPARKTAAPRTPRKTTAPQLASSVPPVIADVSSWKKAPEPMQLPSGNWVVVRRVGMKAFLANGVIPNALMAIVQQALETGQGPSDQELVADMMKDPAKLAEFMSMLDSAAVAAMVQPRVYFMPGPDEERSDELLYADELDEADKMAIFQAASGGTADLEQFRK